VGEAQSEAMRGLPHMHVSERSDVCGGERQRRGEAQSEAMRGLPHMHVRF
jgi:hypothetical protein